MRNNFEGFRKIKLDNDNRVTRVSKIEDSMNEIRLTGRTGTRLFHAITAMACG